MCLGFFKVPSALTTRKLMFFCHEIRKYRLVFKPFLDHSSTTSCWAISIFHLLIWIILGRELQYTIGKCHTQIFTLKVWLMSLCLWRNAVVFMLIFFRCFISTIVIRVLLTLSILFADVMSWNLERIESCFSAQRLSPLAAATCNGHFCQRFSASCFSLSMWEHERF